MGKLIYFIKCLLYGLAGMAFFIGFITGLNFVCTNPVAIKISGTTIAIAVFIYLTFLLGRFLRKEIND